MQLREILNRKGMVVHTIGPQATLDDVVAELVRHNIGSLVVCDPEATGKLDMIGIITERDILRAQEARHSSLKEMRVLDAMSADVITGSSDDRMEHAMRLMTDERIRHLPVIEDGRLLGIISIGDVVKAHHDELEMENQYMRSYIQGEAAEIGTRPISGDDVLTRDLLIVDDSRVERLLIEGLLRSQPDYRVDFAEDGKQALQKLALKSPDLVVTDLVMPEMDGLELVHEMRRHYPNIPVILMTAYGDESIAIEALEAGAASYVPKSQRAERLLTTVNRVLERSSADHCRQRLGQSMLEYHCRFALDNDPQLIRTLVDQIQEVMASLRFTDRVERIRIGEALEEAMLNAMYHGNLEVDADELARLRAELDDRLLSRLIEERCREPHLRNRKTIVVVHITADEVRFVIRVQGRGFNRTYHPTSADRFERGRHRGLTLIESLMDEVRYNAAGNELTMRKHRQAPVVTAQE